MIRLRCAWPYEPWTCTCCGQRIEGAPPASVQAGLACERCLDAGRRGEPYIPLTVRPAAPTRRADERPIVAVSMATSTAAIEDGEAFGLHELVERVRERKPGEIGGRRFAEICPQLPPSIIVADSSIELLAYLETSPAARSPFWQWQVSIRAGSSWRPEARARRQRTYLAPHPRRFGYPSRGRGGRRKNSARWYLLLDPRLFCELPEGWGNLDLAELLRFGIELREFSNREQLPVLQGASSYGSRLLRDSRFAQGWRRKVPAATNARIRPRLPGNHYQLEGRPERAYPEAHKWDQAMAHHHAALSARFPHPDRLEARGWFRRDPPRNGAPMTQRGAIRAGSDEWAELLAHAGMYVLALDVPELLTIDRLQIPALRRAGATWQTVTSDELPAIQATGARVLDIWCAWTSPQDDERLPEYALWAGQRLQAATPAVRRWLKPLLLSTYGMLAARPSRFRNAWRYCAQPAGAIGWNTRRGALIGLERSTGRDRESQSANVLWRAIIEASVRRRSLDFARQLRQWGLRPIAVYADAVFATGEDPPSGTPIPWRYEGTVHDLIFESPARYRSREETRLPGIPRERATVAEPFTGRQAGVTATSERR